MADPAASSEAWSYIIGGGGVTLLVAIGGGLKYLLDYRRNGFKILEEHRQEVLKEYKEIADDSQQELKQAKDDLRRLDSETRVAIQAINDAHKTECAVLRAEILRERAWSMYHFALADFWHGRCRLLWHIATNWAQYAYALEFLLRGFMSRHPGETRPDMQEKLDRRPAAPEEPPPFLHPNETLSKMRPKEPEIP